MDKMSREKISLDEMSVYVVSVDEMTCSYNRSIAYAYSLRDKSEMYLNFILTP
jgi:hypothetical protein